MKITGGKYKNRKIHFRSKRVRPTEAVVRQSVFNIIGNDLSGYRFFDLFTGSGIMGFEALSRNADKVIFNDIDRKNLSGIRRRLDEMEITCDRYTISKKSGLDLIKRIDGGNTIIYFDPPFGFVEMDSLISEFEKYTGIIGIFEFPIDSDYEFSYIINEKVYGDIKIVVEVRDEK